MTRLDLDRARRLFGQMLVNAQALERLMGKAQIVLEPGETAEFADAIQKISISTVRHAAQLQELELAAGLKSVGERRSGVDRRLKVVSEHVQ